MRLVTYDISLTHSTAKDISTGYFVRFIPLSRVTGEPTDISENLDFGFYDKVWYKDNVGLGPQYPDRWLGVAEK